MSARSSPTARRRLADPIFFALLGTIGGTYVLLIVAMLAADARYMFTSHMEVPVQLDFASDADGKPLEAGQAVARQFARFGLVVSSSAGSELRVMDSGRPPAQAAALGTPNVSAGGPGLGRGGTAAVGRNASPLGNVLVAVPARDTDSASTTSTAVAEQTVITWPEPVRVDRVSVAGGLPTQLRLLGPQGGPLGEFQVKDTQPVRVDRDGVIQLVAMHTGRARDVLVDYDLRRSLATSRPGQGRAAAARYHRVPAAAAALRLMEGLVRVTFAWQDPVRLRQLTLVNVQRDGGRVRTYDEQGQPLVTRSLANLGPNSVQSLAMDDGAVTPGSTRPPNVARLEVDLPARAGVAEMEFDWHGRLRPAWERRHPVLARWTHNPISRALAQPEIQYSITLSLISCTLTAILSIWIAVPIGYLLARYRFPGRDLIDAILDIPIVLPPLVVGLSLLILFQFMPLWLSRAVVYQVPAVILAQFSVACAFAVRTMRATFDQIDDRREQVALTLGCSRWQAFRLVVLPESLRGVLTAGTLAWARALGEFGPLLVFAGTTRNKTEVLSTTVFLELNVGNLGAAVAVSLIMVAAAVTVLMLARLWGTRSLAL